MRVATVTNATTQAYLSARHIRHQRYAELEDALVALNAGEVEAVVYDAPILQFLVVHDFPKLHVLPATFERQDYAIAMPTDSPLRERINRAVLRVISKRSWEETLAEYVGVQF